MNANTPGYWDLGYDPTKDRYGIPAAQHPDYKAVVKACRALSAQAEKNRDDQWAAIVAAGEQATSPEALQAAQQAIIDDPKYSNTDLYREMRALCAPAVASNLYRMPYIGTLSVRYDKVGKMAWERELKRLGRK